MELKKSTNNNNAIIIKLNNVRKHPNADCLKLATVLGTTVVVGLDAKDGDMMIYFDSNLRLSHDYLHHNNLYIRSELNVDVTKKGYFGKGGRVRAQKFRGELSNGYVAKVSSIDHIPGVKVTVFNVGDEFTHINGVEICGKATILKPCNQNNKQGKFRSKVTTFHKHWNTKQLMRELYRFTGTTMVYIEEKIHGTSGRIGYVQRNLHRPWWKFWAPKTDWQIMGGTRRMDNTQGHIPSVRQSIEKEIGWKLHKGEQIYFEIYGYNDGGVEIQKGYHYDCRPGEYKVVLYRVTITTPDGYVVDMDREHVYNRAVELGLICPHVFVKGRMDVETIIACAREHYSGQSALDAGTVREGVVVWFQTEFGKWMCLKHKSEKFLIKESKYRDCGEQDIEDFI